MCACFGSIIGSFSKTVQGSFEQSVTCCKRHCDLLCSSKGCHCRLKVADAGVPPAGQFVCVVCGSLPGLGCRASYPEVKIIQ